MCGGPLGAPHTLLRPYLLEHPHELRRSHLQTVSDALDRGPGGIGLAALDPRQRPDAEPAVVRELLLGFSAALALVKNRRGERLVRCIYWWHSRNMADY
jgi:hypothetical protein